MPTPHHDPFDISLAELRRRTSAKWSLVEPDVLPAWVAEMDVRLAPAVAQALHAAIDISDSGYAGDASAALSAMVDFHRDRFGWSIDQSQVRTFSDVHVAAVIIVRHLLEQLGPENNGVIITPPVYNSFYMWMPEAGARVVEVPLLEPERGGRFDLAGFEAAMSAGAKILLLSSPHNPTGRVFTRDELAELAALAHRHDVIVIADEIHAPLTFPGTDFVPWMTVSPEAREVGIWVGSASKSWNLAGFKAAFVYTERENVYPADRTPENTWGAGLFGLISAEAAYRDSRDWLDDVRAGLAKNATLLGRLLGEHLPEVGYHPPEASYLAWLNVAALDLGPNPTQTLLDEGRIFVSPGPIFGASTDWIRLNIGTSPTHVREYVARIAAVVANRR